MKKKKTSEPVSKLQTPFGIAAAWFVALLLLFVFDAPLSDALLFLPFRWCFIAVPCGLMLWALQAWAFSKPRNHNQLIAMTVTCAVGLTLYFTIGFQFGRRVLFEIRQPHYEAMLASAMVTGEIPGGDGHVESGPPQRFAFYWQRGVTDNWVGAVYDPTGDIARINHINDWSDRNDPEVDGLVELFGGTFYSCESVGGGWYLCWFT